MKIIAYKRWKMLSSLTFFLRWHFSLFNRLKCQSINWVGSIVTIMKKKNSNSGSPYKREQEIPISYKAFSIGRHFKN